MRCVLASVKMSGATFKVFYSDPSVWGESGFHEDEIILINGSPRVEDDQVAYQDVSDTDEIEIKHGYIYESPLQRNGDPIELSRAASKWLKSRTEVKLLVSCPADKENELRALLASCGFAKVV